MDAATIQRTWDAQQESYLPDREDRFAVMIDLVEAQTGTRPRVLDLAGGTGSITRRLLARLPEASAVVLDRDPVLLAVARATFAADPRVAVVEADLTDPSWSDQLPSGHDRGGSGFDAVLTATALHWLRPDDVAAVYRRVRTLLRPGGLLANADHIPDPGLPDLTRQRHAAHGERARQRQRATGADGWDTWWTRLRGEPGLVDAFATRDATAPPHDHTRSAETSAWHIEALGSAGFVETGLLWRSNDDAIVVGLR